MTSSARIAQRGFTFALESLPVSPSATRTSRSTDGDPIAGEWTTAPEVDRDDAGNGSWDPLSAVMAGDPGEPDVAVADQADLERAVVEIDHEVALAEDAATEPDSWLVSGEPLEGDERLVAGKQGPSSKLDDAVEELRFIRLSENATLPTRANEGDAGLDLYAAESARIAPGGRVSVGTGLAVAIPGGLAGLVLPRSGNALKQGITLANSPGLIDSGYRGEVRILLLNTDRTSEVRIAAGDRIAQLVLVPIATASPLEAGELDDTVRGSGGFGSSGA